MPLVLDPDSYSEGMLTGIVQDLREGLLETLELVRHPRGEVLDRASLGTAEELVTTTLAVLDRPGARDRHERAREANLAYAVMIATIDLVKSHTAVPRVPVRRPAPGT
jgi:hypothetical protein